jgi:fructan beta-fructosidase
MREILSIIGVWTMLACNSLHAADDLVVEDFESGTYTKWTVTGEAFGRAPAAGTLPGQMAVSGYRGKGLANSFYGGDKSTGTATSAEFTIDRSHIAFLIGGGSARDKLGMQLLVGGDVVRTATGEESEELLWSSWEVNEFKGRKVRLRIIDSATESWGHICVDHIIQTNVPSKVFGLDEKVAQYRKQRDHMNEPLRPQFHFSPEVNWMNDPNGLVFHDGEYHLFHQYNPAGNSWGHMSWGHAVSRDLVHWKHLPLAIPETAGVMAFSGCCVVDHRNTSGFGHGAKPPMVAVYTGHGHGKQVQNLAYSNDNGRTWTMYEKNPVLDPGKQDFRDPKVFWHEPTKRWVMVVSLAAEKVLVFYGSDNLKSWTELSRFGPAGVTNKPNWECPDLFELPVAGEPGRKLWVLKVDMGAGAVAGGSGGEYFVGTFDGSHFKTLQRAQWVDYGRDFYAPISWDNMPESDGRRVWIGWFNNWETSLLPTSPWRSCMSVPRALSLKKVAFNKEEPPGYVLIQKPVDELLALRTKTYSLDTSKPAWPPVSVTAPGDLPDMTFELKATLRPGTARSVGFRIRTGEDEFTEVAYDRSFAAVYVDRAKAGNVSFHPAFAGRHHAPTRLIDGEITLRILVDRSTIEVFANDGEAVISDNVFPSGGKPVIEVFAGDQSAKVSAATLNPLKTIWRDAGRK